MSSDLDKIVGDVISKIKADPEFAADHTKVGKLGCIEFVNRFYDDSVTLDDFENAESDEKRHDLWIVFMMYDRLRTKYRDNEMFAGYQKMVEDLMKERGVL